MPEMLLINPRKRRAARKTPKKARRTSKRRRNPINTIRSRSAAPRRRTNPIRFYARKRRAGMRRRRNPISLGGSARTVMTMVKDALIGGAGAAAFDVAYAKLAPMLPASLQKVPGTVGAGDAVKAVLTALVGKALSRPTKGLSVKMAQGALTVQAHGIIKAVAPASLGLGWYSPAQVADMSARIGPMRRGAPAMGAYVPGSPLLNAYTRGGSPILRGNMSPRAREGVTIR